MSSSLRITFEAYQKQQKCMRIIDEIQRENGAEIGSNVRREFNYKPRSMVNCKFYGSAAGCKHGNKCQYSHNNPNSIPLCTNYKPCTYGNKCQFRHKIFADNNQPIQPIQPQNIASSLSKEMDISLLDALCTDYNENMRKTINASKNILTVYGVIYGGSYIKQAKYRMNTRGKEIKYEYKIKKLEKVISGTISYESFSEETGKKMATIHIINDIFYELFNIKMSSFKFKLIEQNINKLNKYKLINYNDNINNINGQTYFVHFDEEWNILENIYKNIERQIFKPLYESIMHEFINKKKIININLIDALLKHLKSTIKRIKNIMNFYGIEFNDNCTKIKNAKYFINTPKTKMITYIFDHKIQFEGVENIHIYKERSFENLESYNWDKEAIKYCTIKMIENIFYKLFKIKLSSFKFKFERKGIQNRYKCKDQEVIKVFNRKIGPVQFDGYLSLKRTKQYIMEQFFFELCDIIQINFKMNDNQIINYNKNHNINSQRKRGEKRKFIENEDGEMKHIKIENYKTNKRRKIDHEIIVID